MATITETIVTDSAAASSAEQGGAKPRVRWNEDGIAKDMEERGKVYGTMKIDQLETPYLYLDQDGGEEVAIHPKYLPTHVPAAEPTGASWRMQATQWIVGAALRPWQERSGSSSGSP